MQNRFRLLNDVINTSVDRVAHFTELKNKGEASFKQGNVSGWVWSDKFSKLSISVKDGNIIHTVSISLSDQLHATNFSCSCRLDSTQCYHSAAAFIALHYMGGRPIASVSPYDFIEHQRLHSA